MKPKYNQDVANGIASQLEYIASLLRASDECVGFNLTWDGEQTLVDGTIALDTQNCLRNEIHAQRERARATQPPPTPRTNVN